jgi:peptidoglycan/xylan/chitin deacetylase (PgdA/CDA1 family)
MLRILAFSFALVASVACAQPSPTAPVAPAGNNAGTPPAETAPKAKPVAPAETAATPAAATAPAPTAAPTAPAAKKTAASARISVSQCNVDGPFAAITFDDGPHGSQTPRLLKMLKERGIRSTFFVVGQCVAANPEIAKQIVAEGHEIASHSWSHPLLSQMGEEGVRDQLQRTHDVIRQETGVVPTLMRPPFGGFTATQKAWAHGVWGYKCILWDVDSNDWKHRSPAKTQSIILASSRPGSIILCHDIHKSTIDAMPATLDGLLAKGLKLVTVSELLKLEAERPAPAASAKPAAAARTLTPKEGAAAATSLGELQSAEAAKPAPAKP